MPHDLMLRDSRVLNKSFFVVTPRAYFLRTCRCAICSPDHLHSLQKNLLPVKIKKLVFLFVSQAVSRTHTVKRLHPRTSHFDTTSEEALFCPCKRFSEATYVKDYGFVYDILTHTVYMVKEASFVLRELIEKCRRSVLRV